MVIFDKLSKLICFLTLFYFQVKVRGKSAIYINVLLSLLLAISSVQGKISLPPEIAVYFKSLQKYYYIIHTNPNIMQVLNYWIQFIIATGFVVNSVGYYQTKSVGIFLNSCSWVLMFFLTLYPAEYEAYVTVLKVNFFLNLKSIYTKIHVLPLYPPYKQTCLYIVTC